MRIVADTNLLISSIFWNGKPYYIVQLALNNSIEIITSSYILNETRRVLRNEFNLSEQEIDDIINCILRYATVIEPTEQVDVIKRDPADNHIIACALAAKADYVVTRDKDILDLHKYVMIRMITPEDFLEIVTPRS